MNIPLSVVMTAIPRVKKACECVYVTRAEVSCLSFSRTLKLVSIVRN